MIIMGFSFCSTHFLFILKLLQQVPSIECDYICNVGRMNGVQVAQPFLF